MKTDFIIKALKMILVIVVLQNSCKKDDQEPNVNWTPGDNWIDTRDGQSYATVQIGDQVWMAENLNFHSESGSWVYDNDSSNAEVYGRLYYWNTVCDVCPESWHLPTDSEWKELEMLLGMSLSEASEINFRGTDEGGKLKETGMTHWSHPNAGATNSSGFNALPGGYRDCDGYFDFIGIYGFFWSSTEYLDGAWSRELHCSSSQVSRDLCGKNSGFSIRCLKD